MLDELEIIKFSAETLLKPLVRKISILRKKKSEELNKIVEIFPYPEELAKFYVQPNVRHHNPADFDEDFFGAISYLEIGAFETINRFLSGQVATKDGRNQLFIIGDAGMGKTSLLLMLKLMELGGFWPKKFTSFLHKLNESTLETISKIENKKSTILLLDALDEDPVAYGRIRERLIEILDASSGFRRVIITCRTQYFPEKGIDPFGRSGRVEIGGYICPMYFLAPFNDKQCNTYLKKRFPFRFLHLFNKNKKLTKGIKIAKDMGSLKSRPLLLAYIDDFIVAEDELAIYTQLDKIDYNKEVFKSKGIFDIFNLSPLTNNLNPGKLQKPANDQIIKSWNQYTIYETLVSAWLKREERKLRKLNFEVSPNSQILWYACSRIACIMQSIGVRELSEIQIQQRLRNNDQLRFIHKFEFGGRSLLNRNSTGNFRFAHYSIQEFLVAWSIINNNVDMESDRKLKCSPLIIKFLQQHSISEKGSYIALPDCIEFDEALLSKTSYSFKFPEIGGRTIEMISFERKIGTISDHEFSVATQCVSNYEYSRFRSVDNRLSTPNSPIMVNRYDAKSYINWLNNKLGTNFRLLWQSELEVIYTRIKQPDSTELFDIGEFLDYNPDIKGAFRVAKDF